MLVIILRRMGLLFGLCFLLANAAYSYPLVSSSIWSVNGHMYRVYGGTSFWSDAVSFAATVTVPGYYPGYLATVHSAEENEFIRSLLTGPAWLGGYQEPTELDPEANWKWVSGEPWTYTNWEPGQPNDRLGPGSEQLLVMYTSGYWHDFPDTVTRPRFVVELNPVPEPATALMLGAGIVGLLFRRRSK